MMILSSIKYINLLQQEVLCLSYIIFSSFYGKMFDKNQTRLFNRDFLKKSRPGHLIEQVHLIEL